MYIYKNKQNHICVGVSSWYVCILVDFVASSTGNFCWILHLEFVLLPSWSYRGSWLATGLIFWYKIFDFIVKFEQFIVIFGLNTHSMLEHKAVWIQTAHVNQRLKSLVYSFFLIILQCPEQPRYHQDLISYIPNVGKIPPQRSSGKSSKSKGFCDRHWCCGM